MFKQWVAAIIQGILATVLVALVPGVVVAYLAKMQSAWTVPILMGLCATTLVSIVLVA